MDYTENNLRNLSLERLQTASQDRLSWERPSSKSSVESDSFFKNEERTIQSRPVTHSYDSLKGGDEALRFKRYSNFKYFDWADEDARDVCKFCALGKEHPKFATNGSDNPCKVIEEFVESQK